MVELDDSDLEQGMKFLVGTWEVSYVVDNTSEDMDHIPVDEYKEKTGKDLSGITYEFLDDHTVKLKDGATDKEESGTWEQKGYSTFAITVGKFYGDVDDETLKTLQTVEKDFFDNLSFTFGTISIAMKKQGGFADESTTSYDWSTQLDEDDLSRGKRFLVGTWEVSYIVDNTSEDMDQIPAAEYKGADGKDFSKITYEFLEDNTVKMKDGATDKEESGTWEQKGYSTFAVTVGKFYGDVDDDTLKTLQTVERNFSDELMFTFGNIKITMQKQGGFPDGEAEPVFKPYTVTLDEDDLIEGKKFIVGTWQVDYIVNAFSNNLDHIPAKEFKSEDGKDFSEITFEFFEDQTMKMKNGATSLEENGTWEQKSYSTFEYTVGKFFGEVDETLLKNIQKLEKNFEGELVFSLGFIVIGMKKIADGVVTIVEKPKEPSIADIEPTEDDLKKKDIVGRWKVYKMFSVVGDDFGLHTLDEVKADIEKKKAAGEETDEKDTLLMFGMVLDFKDDYSVASFTALPPGASQEEIDAAVASGEIKLQDGMIVGDDERKWKFVNGEYWCSQGDNDEPWQKITPGEDGRMDMRMMILEKM